MPAKLKLTNKLVDQIVELKRDGLCDADIIAAVGVNPSTFYRWLKDGENAKSGVKRTLYEEIKKGQSKKLWVAPTSPPPPCPASSACWSRKS